MNEKYLVPPDCRYSQTIWRNFTVKEFAYLIIFAYPAIMVIRNESLSMTFRLIIAIPFVALGVIAGKYTKYGLGVEAIVFNRINFLFAPKIYRQYSSGPKRRTPNTKDIIPLKTFRHDVLVISDNLCIKVIKCSCLNFALLSEQEKGQVESSFRELCHSLSLGFPLQFYIRSRSMSPDDLIRQFEKESRGVGNQLARKIYLDFLRGLATERNIHQKEFFIVLPFNRFYSGGRTMKMENYTKIAKGVLKREKEQLDMDEAEEHLKMREGIVTQGLRRLGLEAQVIKRADIIQVLYETFNPDPEGDLAKRDDIRPFLSGGLSKDNLLEIIAPSAVDLAADYIRIGSLFVKLMPVMGWPTSLWPGWVQFMNDISEDIDVSIHITPKDMAHEMRFFATQVKKMHGNTMADKISGMPADHFTLVKKEQAENLLRKMAAGEEKLFDFTCILAIKARSEKELKEKTQSIRSRMNAREIDIDVPRNMMKEALLTFVPMGMQRLPFKRSFTSSLMGASFPLTSYDMSSGGGILYGIGDDGSSCVYLDRFQQNNHNICICGSSGFGKSFYAKSLILGELALAGGRGSGEGIEVVILDPEREYESMCRALGGQHVVFAPRSDSSINPLDRSFRLDDKSFTGKDALVRECMLFMKLIIEDARLEYSPLEAEEVLYELFNRFDHPLLADLRRLADQLGHKEIAHALYPWTEGTLKGLFDQPTNVDLNSDFVVFDLSKLKREHRGLAIQVIETWFWKKITDDKKRRIFQVDEASWLLRDYDCAEAFEQLARRGRKYGVGFTIIDQQLDQLFANEKSRAIVANCAIKALFGMDKGIVDNYVGKAISITERERELMVGLLRGECILHAGPQRAKVHVEASDEMKKLFSTTIGEAA